MGWSSLEVAAGCNEDLRLVLEAAWAVAFQDAFLSFRSALFCKREASGGSTLYFSPGARALADALGAKPCRDPLREELRLVIGDYRAWQACFPSERPARRILGTLRLWTKAP